MELPSIDAEGWLPGVRHLPSPNADERPLDAVASLVVIHAISLPPSVFGGEWVFDLFLNRLDPDAHPYFSGIHQLRVSSHFLVRRDGEIVQFVSCNRRAWHAGVSEWKGVARCNDFSIGIELEGCDDQGFDAEQYDALRALLQAISQRYPIADVAGHCHIAPQRKTDPGPFFDWSRVTDEFPLLHFPLMQKS